jgi:hypothetical protein
MRRPPTLAQARAAVWTRRAARSARSQLERGEVSDVRVPPAPDVPIEASRGVRVALERLNETCLVESLVRQRWLLDHGKPVDLVIGVNDDGQPFGAHAWLEGDPPSSADGFAEITRIPAQRT